MKSTDFLDEIVRAYGLKNDTALAAFMGWSSPSRVSNYRCGRSHFDEDTCIQVATKLHLEPLYVMACVNAERTPSPRARETWLRLAEDTRARVVKMAAVAVFAAFASAHNINADAGSLPFSPIEGGTAFNSMYIMLFQRCHGMGAGAPEPWAAWPGYPPLLQLLVQQMDLWLTHRDQPQRRLKDRRRLFCAGERTSGEAGEALPALGQQ